MQARCTTPTLTAHPQEHSQRYLDSYHAPAAIDTLHEATVAAKARDLASPPPKDAWRPNLEPRAVVRARLAPLMEREQQRMLQVLREVRPPRVVLSSSES